MKRITWFVIALIASTLMWACLFNFPILFLILLMAGIGTFFSVDLHRKRKRSFRTRKTR